MVTRWHHLELRPKRIAATREAKSCEDAMPLQICIHHRTILEKEQKPSWAK